MKLNKDITNELVSQLIKLDDSILKKHLDASPEKRVHWCRYCGGESDWYSSISHGEDCPISIMKRVRNILKIPSWFHRNLDSYKEK